MPQGPLRKTIMRYSLLMMSNDHTSGATIRFGLFSLAQLYSGGFIAAMVPDSPLPGSVIDLGATVANWLDGPGLPSFRHLARGASR